MATIAGHSLNHSGMILMIIFTNAIVIVALGGD